MSGHIESEREPSDPPPWGSEVVDLKTGALELQRKIVLEVAFEAGAGPMLDAIEEWRAYEAPRLDRLVSEPESATMRIHRERVASLIDQLGRRRAVAVLLCLARSCHVGEWWAPADRRAVNDRCPSHLDAGIDPEVIAKIAGGWFDEGMSEQEEAWLWLAQSLGLPDFRLRPFTVLRWPEERKALATLGGGIAWAAWMSLDPKTSAQLLREREIGWTTVNVEFDGSVLGNEREVSRALGRTMERLRGPGGT